MRAIISYIFLVSALLAQDQYGNLAITVLDEATHQPLLGANVFLIGELAGAPTDSLGLAYLTHIPSGNYNVQIEMIGYESVIKPMVQVVPRRELAFQVALKARALVGREVIVAARLFERTSDAVASAHTVDVAEIRTDPAGAYDIQRMMEALPAVVLGSDQHNELIVRGGGVGENLFIMDHIEIPNPNHFGEPGSTGGAVNVINSSFIRRIDFYAGAFPARYRERASSVMDVTLREGNRHRFQSHVEASMAGFGAVVEGPVWQGRGSYLASYRKSFLDLVIRSVGLTAVPHYANWQAKAVYDINPRTKLTFNLLGGTDGIDLEGSTVPQTRGIANVLSRGRQNTFGLTLKSLYSKQGYLLVSFARASTSTRYDLYNYLPGGQRQNLLDLNDQTVDVSLKGDLNYRINQHIDIDFGFIEKWGTFTRDTFFGADTVWRYRYADATNSQPRWMTTEEFSAAPGIVIFQDTSWIAVQPERGTDSPFKPRQHSAYGQISFLPTLRWEIITGIRRYQLQPQGKIAWSVRFGAAYKATDRLTLSLAYGTHVQPPAYNQLFFSDVIQLDYVRVKQLVAGLSHMLAPDVRGSIELYRKEYDNLLVERALISPDTLDTFRGVVNAGMGYSYGVELFLQKKFTSVWYGSVSYSAYRSLADDPRPDFAGVQYSRPADYGQLFTLVGGYKLVWQSVAWLPDWRESGLGRILSWLPIGPADEIDLSFRIRYVGGRPYTPQVYKHTIRRWMIAPDVQLNRERLGHYLRFDLLISRRIYLPKVNIVMFIDVQNILNRDNPWDLVYYHDGSSETALQYKQFPVGGVTLEF